MCKKMRKPYYILGSETDNLNIKLGTRNEAQLALITIIIHAQLARFRLYHYHLTHYICN